MNSYPLRMVLLLMVMSATALFVNWDEGQAKSLRRCFAETNRCVEGRIREFWEQNGGLAVFGFPISPLQEQVVEGRVLHVQWFERTRMELHPEQPMPYDVLLGRIGAERLAQLGRNQAAFPKGAPRQGCVILPESEHNVCGPILAAWRANGLEFDQHAGTSEAESLALFGLPLGEESIEQLSDGRQYTVQWFERARFEIHPENNPPYHVLLGLLGTEVHSAISPTPTLSPSTTPTLRPSPTSRPKRPKPKPTPRATPAPTRISWPYP